MAIHKSEGVFSYSVSESTGHKLELICDQGIADFYFALIPRWLYACRQKHRCHVSVVRKEKAVVKPENWGRHEGEKYAFFYDSDVKTDGVYFWLNVYSKALEDVRLGLGLGLWCKRNLVDGFRHTFHMTIGNLKHQKKST